MRLGAFLMIALLAGCGPQAGGERAAGGQGSEAQSSPAPAARLSALEQQAVDAGLITDAQNLSPVGLYRLRHEAGRDSLCMVPSKNDASGSEMQFGLEASFGENIDCQGHGTARQTGDKLVLDFTGSSCVIIAHYEGDRIAIPGALDTQCRKLCQERGSLEGVAFPRVSREASVAAAADAAAGGRLCS